MSAVLPLLVVGETVADAESVAAQIGVDDFTIVTLRSHAQVGRVIRGFVLTPRFAMLLEANDLAASQTFRCARRDASKSGVGSL